MECLILLGRLDDAEGRAEALAPGIHKSYLLAEIQLRKGAPADALRYGKL